ncbi:MAG: UbiA family prenyltransferase [Pseudomonadales bacterium]|nr:UbiA family prenyltransferase [Pseudomonadales bacterium]
MPLIVDLDGTLIKTDLLIESFLGLLKLNPFYVIAVFFWLIKGKANLKQEIAARVDIDVSILPYNTEFVDYLKAQKKAGRQIALATASHKKYAEQVGDFLGIFDQIFATEGDINNADSIKSDVLCNAFGNKKFVYAGNSSADLSVWQRSAFCIVVGWSNSLLSKAEKLAPLEKHFAVKGPSFGNYIKSFRIHQWVKNSLILVPVTAAHEFFNVELLSNSLIAFLAFSLCASSVYLLNDLLDLDSDRRHKTKKYRPFAAGTLPALHGILLIPVLLILVLTLLLFLPLQFAFVLVVYYVATTAYSFVLKRKIMLDVIVLSGLYTVRIVAGSAATGILLSQWLLVFSMFIFLSLALVKRYTELMDMRGRGESLQIRGRGYEVDDIELLASLGAASGYISVLIMALYINSDFVQQMYPNSILLWGVCPLMLYWVSRVWIIAHRGEMHDDPIVFAIKDSVSRYTVAIIGAIFVCAGFE